MAKQIHIHTVLKKGKGVRGETMPENDRLALASFGHRWNELARHEKCFYGHDAIIPSCSSSNVL